MFYHSESNTYITEGQPFVINDIQYPQNWLNLSTPQDKTDLGLEEVTTAGVREDDRYFWVSEELVGAVRTITSTPKDPEMVAEMKAGELQARINQLEQETLLPRATREFMLLFMESSFPAEALAANFGYQKVKAFDAKVRAVREGTWVEPEVLL